MRHGMPLCRVQTTEHSPPIRTRSDWRHHRTGPDSARCECEQPGQAKQGDTAMKWCEQLQSIM